MKILKTKAIMTSATALAILIFTINGINIAIKQKPNPAHTPTNNPATQKRHIIDQPINFDISLL